MLESNSKVTASHLKREAYLYIRQSTMRQLFENTESTQRQYALRQRALALGWTVEQVQIIDSDQGQSGASAADREGFQKLVAESRSRAGGDSHGTGSIPPGPQQRRLASPAGNLRPFRYPDSR